MHYKKDRVALKPPLGWNSWDCYGPAVNEVQLLGNARYMAEHLKAHGWQYVVCDIQWYEQPEAGQRHWEYNRFAELSRKTFFLYAVRRARAAAETVDGDDVRAAACNAGRNGCNVVHRRNLDDDGLFVV